VGCDDICLEKCWCNEPKSYEFHDLLGVLMEVYIDDVVVKLVGLEEHMTDLKLSLERMKEYWLWMNPLKCAFGVTSGKFLGFVVHKRGMSKRCRVR
jgi:hypothetical protein